MTQDRAMQAAAEFACPDPDHGDVNLSVRAYLSALVEDPEVGITITVCRRSGQLPHECGLSACDNGCSTEDIDFVRLTALRDRAAGGGP